MLLCRFLADSKQWALSMLIYHFAFGAGNEIGFAVLAQSDTIPVFIQACGFTGPGSLGTALQEGFSLSLFLFRSFFCLLWFYKCRICTQADEKHTAAHKSTITPLPEILSFSASLFLSPSLRN